MDLLIGLWEYLHLSAHRGATRWLLGEADVPPSASASQPLYSKSALPITASC